MHDRLSPELQQVTWNSTRNKKTELVLRSANDVLYCITQMDVIPQNIKFRLRKNWTVDGMDKYQIGANRGMRVGVEIARKFSEAYKNEACRIIMEYINAERDEFRKCIKNEGVPYEKVEEDASPFENKDSDMAIQIQLAAMQRAGCLDQAIVKQKPCSTLTEPETYTPGMNPQNMSGMSQLNMSGMSQQNMSEMTQQNMSGMSQQNMSGMSQQNTASATDDYLFSMLLGFNGLETVGKRPQPSSSSGNNRNEIKHVKTERKRSIQIPAEAMKTMKHNKRKRIIVVKPKSGYSTKIKICETPVVETKVVKIKEEVEDSGFNEESNESEMDSVLESMEENKELAKEISETLSSIMNAYDCKCEECGSIYASLFDIEKCPKCPTCFPSHVIENSTDPITGNQSIPKEFVVADNVLQAAEVIQKGTLLGPLQGTLLESLAMWTKLVMAKKTNDLSHIWPVDYVNDYLAQPYVLWTGEGSNSNYLSAVGFGDRDTSNLLIVNKGKEIYFTVTKNITPGLFFPVFYLFLWQKGL